MWFRFCSYIRYRIKRKRSAHSAFVYDFIVSVLKQKKYANDWVNIEGVRKQLLKNKQELHVIDLTENRDHCYVSSQRVCTVTKKFSSPAKIEHVLYNIVKHYNIQNIVEFGTYVGINTAYLAKANPNARIFTIEASPEIVKIASDVFEQLNLSNIEIANIDSDAAIVHFANKFKDIDLFFIDGNHVYDAIIRYFNFMKMYAKENSIFLLSEIHRSKEMEEVWRKIQSDTSVSITIDLYNIGIVFFRSGIVKQDFIL